MAEIAFAGLGVMGGPMAHHLCSTHHVTGFNRTYEKTLIWAEIENARSAKTIEDLVSLKDALVLCIGNDDDVRDVVTRALPHMKAGALIIDHTTTSAKLAQEMAVAAKPFGVSFCDAPVSGGEAGAKNANLTVMVGCQSEIFESVCAIIKPYAPSITRIGEAGAGQMAKMANQIAIAGVVQGLAEAVHFTKSAGLDPQLVFQAISKGAAGSWQMSNRWSSMCEGRFDFGFAVDWMRKDLGLVLDEAKRNGAQLELVQIIDQYYAEVQALGGQRWDTSSLLTRLENKHN